MRSGCQKVAQFNGLTVEEVRLFLKCKTTEGETFIYTLKDLLLMSQAIVVSTTVIGSPRIMVGESAPLVEARKGDHIIGETLISILLATASLTRGQHGMDNVMESLTEA